MKDPKPAMSSNPSSKSPVNRLPETLNVSANHTGLVARELKKLDIDPQPIFDEAGIEIPSNNNPAKRISTAQLCALMNLIIDKTGDPTIGLKIYGGTQLGDLDALGFAVSCSSTFLSLIQRFQRFSKYISSASIMQIVEERDGYLLMVDQENTVLTEDLILQKDELAIGERLTEVTKEHREILMLLEMFAVGFFKLSSEVCQETIIPTKVYYSAFSHPDVLKVFNSILTDSSFQQAPFFGVKFSKDIAEKKLPLANPEMARLNDEIIIKHLEEIYKNDIVLRVESCIREGLAVNEFSLSDVAVKLGMSERKLQQELDERSTTFSDLLLKIRKTLAMQYVREDNLRINQIAYLLGFANGSNFTRSFKSWTGYTPNEFKDL